VVHDGVRTYMNTDTQTHEHPHAACVYPCIPVTCNSSESDRAVFRSRINAPGVMEFRCGGVCECKTSGVVGSRCDGVQE
jgi:hypothetical protein